MAVISPDISIVGPGGYVDSGGGSVANLAGVTFSLYNPETNTTYSPGSTLLEKNQYYADGFLNSNSECFFTASEIINSRLCVRILTQYVSFNLVKIELIIADGSNEILLSTLNCCGGNTWSATCNCIPIQAGEADYSTDPVTRNVKGLRGEAVLALHASAAEYLAYYSHAIKLSDNKYQYFPIGSGNPWGGTTISVVSGDKHISTYGTKDVKLKITYFGPVSYNKTAANMVYDQQDITLPSESLQTTYRTVGTISILPPVLKKISRNSESTNAINYKKYEIFYKTGLLVDTHYAYQLPRGVSNNPIAYIERVSASKVSTSPENATVLETAGAQTVTVTYSNKSFTYTIYVKDVFVKFGNKSPTLYIKLNGTRKTVKEIRLKNTLVYKHD